MTKEALAAHIEQFRRDHQNHLEQAYMCLGAIQFAQHLLAEPEPPQQQQAPAPEPPGNLVEFPKRETSPPIGEPS